MIKNPNKNVNNNAMKIDELPRDIKLSKVYFNLCSIG
jgi:hypothetical protein